MILFSGTVDHKYTFFIKLVKYNEYFVSIVDTNSQMLYHWCISSQGTEYPPMYFQDSPLLIWFNFNLSMDK